MSIHYCADSAFYVRVIGMEVFKGVESVLPGANIFSSFP